ncbi:MAG: hypothetical protein JNM44_12520 [Chitinophagaceae bacterium]|nr:hypothetical protein [Chitinophagaceae bacterium]
MRKVIFLTILFLLLFGTGYVYWFYYNSHSDGTRDGILYKFSRKGNIFKTYEGEMVQPGLRSVQGGVINTNNFYFSVSDAKLADSLDKCIGKNVKVHYVQYRKCLPWRGENYNGKNQENGQYMIDRIEMVSEARMNSGF